MTKQIEKDLKNKLTKKDYLLYLINRNSFILLSPLIIVALLTLSFFMINKDGFDSNDLLYLLPILLFILSYLQMYTSINHAYKVNSTRENLKIILNEKRYKEITSNGENQLEYNKFYSYYENKNYYYLYVDKINALILPKREFSKDEISIIDEYFSKSMKKTKLFNLKNILEIALGIALVISIIVLLIYIY